MKYSVDTSAILDGWVRYYPRDIFPAVWERLEYLIETGTLVATEEVLHELQKRDDKVYEWACERKDMFLAIDDDIQIAVAEILHHHPKLIDTRKNRSGADPWVIALAKVHGYSVLAGERPTGSAKRPHIPDVCHALKIPYATLVDLFRQQKWRF